MEACTGFGIWRQNFLKVLITTVVGSEVFISVQVHSATLSIRYMSPLNSTMHIQIATLIELLVTIGTGERLLPT